MFIIGTCTADAVFRKNKMKVLYNFFKHNYLIIIIVIEDLDDSNRYKDLWIPQLKEADHLKIKKHYKTEPFGENQKHNQNPTLHQEQNKSYQYI